MNFSNPQVANDEDQSLDMRMRSVNDEVTYAAGAVGRRQKNFNAVEWWLFAGNAVRKDIRSKQG